MTYRLTMAPLPISTRDVVFDITRLYRNRAHPFGTGIDRIDLAVGLGLVARFDARCRFAYVWLGGFVEVPVAEGQKLLQVLDARWHHGAAEQWAGLGRLVSCACGPAANPIGGA